MSDFSPETRNSAWWSSDSRLAAQGRANEAILTKQGKMERPDLSNVEAVQMGHVMEPVIGQLASQKLGIGLSKIEHSITHPKHEWFRSHFDFAGELQGENILVECKNYNAGVRSKFDPEAGIMPAADRAQLVHEAAVFGVRQVYLAVLFGGQEFTLTKVEVTDEEKDNLIQQMAQFWAAVQTRQPLPPESVEQAKALFPIASESSKTASKAVEEACLYLRGVKAQIKALEAQEEALQTTIQGWLADSDTLLSVDGSVLATWKQSKGSKRFDAKLFQQSMPDIYEQYVRPTEGSRRFLIK